MDSSKIKIIIIGAISAFCALYLGVSAATAQFETIGWVLGGLTVSACLLLGRNIWLLIPFLAAINLQLRIPTQPNTLLLAQVLVLAFSVFLVGARKVTLNFKFTELEFWMIGLALFVAQVYARNPAGVWVFQSEIVGGKAYALLLITFVTAIYLCSIVVDPISLKRIFPLVVFGSIINVSVGALGKLFPTIGFYTGANFSINESQVGGAIDEGRATRFLELSVFGQKLSLFVSALKNPLRAALHPLWAGAILMSLAFCLFGGFRSGFAAAALTYMVGTWYRGGFMALLIGSVAGILFVMLLAFVNLINPLPPNVQRSLTFLPGTWEQHIKDDAKGSTEWRTEIWREVLTTDRWIQNKLWGDGLGFTSQQLAYQMSLRENQASGIGLSGWDLQREGVLASGDYHSGPVSSVRIVGYMGLGFLILFQLRLAVHAHRQIMRCRGTEWYPLALLIGIPLIWQPIYFHLIFGDFRSEAVAILIGAAMIRILERTLPLPPYQRARVSLPGIQYGIQQQPMPS